MSLLGMSEQPVKPRYPQHMGAIVGADIVYTALEGKLGGREPLSAFKAYTHDRALPTPLPAAAHMTSTGKKWPRKATNGAKCSVCCARRPSRRKGVPEPVLQNGNPRRSHDRFDFLPPQRDDW